MSEQDKPTSASNDVLQNFITDAENRNLNPFLANSKAFGAQPQAQASTGFGSQPQIAAPNYRAIKDGLDVAYHRDGQEIFRDSGARILLKPGSEQDPANVEAALRLAADKYGDKGIVLNGSDAFKLQAMEVMAQKGIDVKLADKTQAAIFEAVKHKHGTLTVAPLTQQAIDTESLRAIKNRSETGALLLDRPQTTKEFVAADVKDLNSIKDPARKAFAGAQIVENSRDYTSYKIELESAYPDAAKEVFMFDAMHRERVARKEEGDVEMRSMIKEREATGFVDSKSASNIGTSPKSHSDDVRKNGVNPVSNIGSKMNATEFAAALQKLGGEGVGRIELPKQHCGYCGKIIQASDTHIVQKIDKNLAIAHDITKIANGQEILALAEKGQLRNVELNVNYNEKVAEAKQVKFNLDDAKSIIANSNTWATKNISSPQSREAFGKIVQDMAKARTQLQDFNKPAPVQVMRAPAQSPIKPLPRGR